MKSDFNFGWMFHSWNLSGWKDPHLRPLETQFSYRLEVSAGEGRKTVNTGFRFYEFTSDSGFLLNGKLYRPGGGCGCQIGLCSGDPCVAGRKDQLFWHPFDSWRLRKNCKNSLEKHSQILQNGFSL